MIETFRRNALAKNLEEEIGKDRLVLVEGRSRRYGTPFRTPDGLWAFPGE